MKIKVILLGVMGLLLSNIVLANHEIKFDDIWNFKISVTALAKGKYSGYLNKEIIIEKPVKKITFGSDYKVIWQN